MMCAMKHKTVLLMCGVTAAVLAFPAAMATAEKAAGAPETKIAAPDISLADLKQAIADKAVVLLDCNGSKSYAKGHIPGAIDFEVAKTDLAKMMPADKAALVVAYCGGPKCMAYKAGAEAAMKLGYTNVKHFSRGISGWKDAGEKCETATLPPKGDQE
jgi:rhodanese-related sulfurtransferase